MNDILIREVNDAVRRDRAERMWKQNRVLLVALVVAIIVGTAGGQIYRHWKNERNAGFSDALVNATQAINGDDPKAAIAPLERLVAESRGEQEAIAGLWLARAQLRAGDTAQAGTTLAGVIATAERGSAWHDTACIWQAGLLDAWPEGCNTSVGSPLQPAKLELAAADALAAKDWERARTLLAKLREVSANLPEQRSRAQQLSLLLPPQPEAAPAESAPPAKE